MFRFVLEYYLVISTVNGIRGAVSDLEFGQMNTSCALLTFHWTLDANSLKEDIKMIIYKTNCFCNESRGIITFEEKVLTC